MNWEVSGYSILRLSEAEYEELGGPVDSRTALTEYLAGQKYFDYADIVEDFDEREAPVITGTEWVDW